MGEESPPGREQTMAQRLDFLIRTLHPPGRGPYTYLEIADGTKQLPGPSVSHGTVQTIHKGVNTNPGIDSIRALAGFFGVSTGYLADGENSTAVEKRLEERIARLHEETRRAAAADEFAQVLEDENVQAAAFRLGGLSAGSLKSVTALIKHLRKTEGLPDVKPGRGRRTKS
ncbi:XRE family transcriptional regulator [Streptomyces sp. NBC_01244]|uniref:XRE family transcriptional regulator n=1 Tax=Streptomyces sp. NBC_01244 TaxID=2903797 RepID=UPI002E15C6DA|nr:XRE family transcriptional regulator [Streptomyces sp. NBC_01244]